MGKGESEQFFNSGHFCAETEDFRSLFQIGDGRERRGDTQILIQGVFSRSAGGFTAQDYTFVTLEEFEEELEKLADQPVNEDYSRDTFIRNQKSNLESGFMSQEEYDAAMDSLDQYATILK